MSGAGKKDYYEILGVLRTAGPADIAAAYRALARKFHPDTSQADAESLLKFKLVNEAYEILSDTHKRQAYDRSIREASPIPVAVRPFHAPPPERTRDSHRYKSAEVETQDVEVELPITPEEARYGGPCEVTLSIPQSCSRCSGAGRYADTTCSSCQGRGKTRCRRRIQITIPRGVTTGSIVRLSILGKHASPFAGDLIVRLKIKPCW